MPVEYLTEEQEQRYGRYVGKPFSSPRVRLNQKPARISSNRACKPEHNERIVVSVGMNG